MEIPTEPNSEIKEVVPQLTFILSVLAIASLGSVAKLLHDYKDETEIQRSIWAAYLTSGLLAGLVLALILSHLYGSSYLLIGLAGLAGFQSVQLLTWGGLLLQRVVEKIFK